MTRFVVRRVLSALLTLFVIATITFFLMNMIPGGPFNTERASKKTVEMLEAKYGLDKPLFEQYVMYLKRLVRLDLGDSYKRKGFTVNQILDEKFPISAGVGVVVSNASADAMAIADYRAKSSCDDGVFAEVLEKFIEPQHK